MYVQQEELSTMVNSLDKKLETYQKLEKGDILDPPEVIQTSLKEPEVQTVEVGGSSHGIEIYEFFIFNKICRIWRSQ